MRRTSLAVLALVLAVVLAPVRATPARPAAMRDASVRGRIVFNGIAPRSPYVQITLHALDQSARWLPPSGVASDLTFETTPAPPGRYELHAMPGNPLETWRLQRVTIGGRDVTGRPLTIDANDIEDVVVTLTDRPSNLLGAVRPRAAAGTPPAGAGEPWVLLFPTDRALWADAAPGTLRFRSVRTSRGTYFLEALLEGEYFIVVADERVLARWPSNALLGELAEQATRVTIAGARAHFLSLEQK